MTRSVAWLLTLLTAGSFGCSTATTKPKSRTAAPQQTAGTAPGSLGNRVVIVIDDGFDTSAPVFQGKIQASYTVTCPDSGDDSLDWDNLSSADLKTKVLADIQSTSPCTLASGATLASSPSFSGIEADREAWNSGILSKQGVNLTQDVVSHITDVLEGENGQYDYHGTATAGTIAFQNPNVRLVLIEMKLDSEAQAQQAVVCHHQAGIDKYTALLQDPDVVQANTTAPLDPADAQLNDIATKEGATLANLSLGGQARVTLQTLYQQKGCGTVDMTALFTAQNALQVQRDAYLASKNLQGPPILTIKAAGNDGAKIDSPADGDCHDLANNVVTVGAFDYTRKQSTFSNFGACVDLYSLGEDVVVNAPDGFVNVESGTSFSSPLTVRFITLNFPASLSVPDLQTQLLASGDAQHYLPALAYPAVLAFSDKTDQLSAYQLFAGAPHPPLPRQPLTPAGLAALNRRLPLFFHH